MDLDVVPSKSVSTFGKVGNTEFIEKAVADLNGDIFSFIHLASHAVNVLSPTVT